MITYNISEIKGPVYKGLYELIKRDIKNGTLKAHEKMPSKRTFAKNLGISVISVENSYEQLISEGYLYAITKKGYFVSEISNYILPEIRDSQKNSIKIPKVEECEFDFSSNQVDPSSFPFSVWTRIIREVLSTKEKELLTLSPCGGVKELRKAISGHLSSFCGMSVSPDQIIVGAGTEYLYSLLIKLLGKDRIYCIENPGYKKLSKIYKNNDAQYRYAGMDDYGILIEELRQSGAEIAHVSPAHHFPTGITMPVSRRTELLEWANEKDGRYIIEDDYDSEFRLNGKPIPPVQSLDIKGKVVYMNTFSKSLTSTIRISYMVLPEELANKFYEEMSFYSCTVSTFEQYALSEFIKQGYFEKHINRMRLYYGRKRAKVIQVIKNTFTDNECKILENDSGLHFILQLNTELSDSEIKSKLLERKIKISSIDDFNMKEEKTDSHQFILNYSGLNIEKLEDAVCVLKEISSI